MALMTLMLRLGPSELWGGSPQLGSNACSEGRLQCGEEIAAVWGGNRRSGGNAAMGVSAGGGGVLKAGCSEGAPHWELALRRD